MFYYGNIPWHREGRKLDLPADREEAIEFGGLDWEVETVGLRTDEEPSSNVGTRFAIVRKDRPKGHSERVVELLGEEAGRAARQHIISDLKQEGWTENDPFPRMRRIMWRWGCFRRMSRPPFCVISTIRSLA